MKYFLLAVAMLFLGSLIGPVAGAVVGSIVEFVFPQTTDRILTAVGPDLALWEIGAMLGFIGSFFRPSISFNSRQSQS